MRPQTLQERVWPTHTYPEQLAQEMCRQARAEKARQKAERSATYAHRRAVVKRIKPAAITLLCLLLVALALTDWGSLL